MAPHRVSNVSLRPYFFQYRYDFPNHNTFLSRKARLTQNYKRQAALPLPFLFLFIFLLLLTTKEQKQLEN